MDPTVVKLVFHSQLSQAHVSAQCEAKEAKKAKQNPMTLNVGGTLFSTTKETLTRVKDSYFTSMLESGNWKPRKDGTYFIDCNATCLGRILDYLRYDELETDGLSPKLKKMLQSDFDNLFPNTKAVICHTPLNLCSNYMATLRGWLGVQFDATTLLWRGSTDGLNAEAFHSRCDNKGPTLTVVESTEGWIFGGFNPTHWCSPSNGVISHAEGAFLFTLKTPNGSSPHRFHCQVPCHAIYNHAAHGPDFGNWDLVVFNTTGTSHSHFPNHYGNSTGLENDTLIGKKGSFDVKEIEVYSV